MGKAATRFLRLSNATPITVGTGTVSVAFSWNTVDRSRVLLVDASTGAPITFHALVSIYNLAGQLISRESPYLDGYSTQYDLLPGQYYVVDVDSWTVYGSDLPGNSVYGRNV